MDPLLSKLPWTFWAALFVFILFLVVLQTPRVSRIWLSWLPALLRNRIQHHFDPPPAAYSDASDPNKLPKAEDVPIEEQIPLMVIRVLLHAVYGFADFNHYFERFLTTFFIFCVVLIVVVGIQLAIWTLAFWL